MKKLICMFIGFLVLITVIACEHQAVDSEDFKSCLPSNSTNITYIGNGWVTFDLNERAFIYHRSVDGYRAFECISEVSR